MKKNNNYHGKKRNTDSNDRVSNFQSTKKNEAPKVNGGVFIYSKPLSVSELSKAINVPVNQIIKFLFLQGKAVTINQMLDDEMIGTICLQFNYDFKKEENVEASHFEDLKVEECEDGYKRIVLMKDAIKHRYMCHRLVAQEFIPNLENKPYINHINGDRGDNRVEN